MPCALGKVCNWDTVVDSVQSQKKKGTKKTQAVAEKNSNEFGRQRASSDSITRVHRHSLEQKEGKVWQALVLISPAFVETLVFRE